MNLPHSSTVQRIQCWQVKAHAYTGTDPEVSLMFARKAAEAICKILHIDKISPNIPPKDTLGQLLDKLMHGKHLDPRVVVSLTSIQSHGNYGSHDQGDDSEQIDREFVESCMKSLDSLCNWLLKKYLRGQYKSVELPKEPKKEAQGKRCYLKPPITIRNLAEALATPASILIELLRNWELITNLDSEISPEIAERLCKMFNGKLSLNKTSESLHHLGI